MLLSQLQSVSFYGKVYMYINNITFLLNKSFLGEKIIACLAVIWGKYILRN